ncbi:zinc ABC transporter substrate-binding protein ZnuA [Pectobacterium brasiliense]|uniref:High-affinity zinc uptake system protein ZnuA n=1 Tax=Pectobacterium brasiliense TaxID=180957 RepID=A0AAE2WEK6_9GAMM|nr:zinc ABC transporter substrate-binding protein ZnuA [Pectobacterium brasiliense]MBA0216725.1 zinc ABC transporter substrate-binding protein ZnuA [Pectobacterium brasiliense]MBN3051646.1 zinc ABC transporter substrate-binding protein ZnuA [Pectobacterium brasiliense]MBN3073364.1 zinc ABC transporter substrate-binding protein ZnuA [Pectobacterium brasiliense]MBN3169104.1 zinc ABC transporter substrate-binding protein ZnuA [Pectobacterium brasiliense]
MQQSIQQKKWLKSVFVASALLASGMSISAASAAVITSIRPLGFIASAIADGVTPTEVLLPDGASPHDYALRPSDVQRLQSAELVIWVGPEMEAFLAKPLAKVSPEKQITLSALPAIKSGLEKEAGHDHEDDHDQAHDDHGKEHDHSHAAHDDGDDGHHHGEYNMHIWLSPEMTKQAAIAIHAKLLELMPQNKDKLDANLLYFTDKIGQADEKIVKMLAPVQGKGYFVFHDAYGYFEKHYGLSPLGHFTVNPEIQPGAQRLHQIRTQLVEHKAVCIFAEPQFRPAVINAVAKGTDVRSGVLDPLGSTIALGRDSYADFLLQLSNQYVSCLEEKS